MKKLEFKINIAATKKQVWEKMLNATTYKEWTNAGWPDSFYEGKWAEGEEVHFIGNDGSGTLGLIEKYQPFANSLSLSSTPPANKIAMCVAAIKL